MEPPLLDQLLNELAARIAAKLAEHLAGIASAPPQRLLTIEQAAEYLSRSTGAVEHMIASRKIPCVRMDRRVQIDVHDLDAWIDRSKA
jgi:excisionase family DNA binding protein